MNKALVERFTTPELQKRAWKVLVKELGIIDALRYIMATEMGDGDSILQYQKMWEEKDIDEIFEIIYSKKR